MGHISGHPEYNIATRNGICSDLSLHTRRSGIELPVPVCHWRVDRNGSATTCVLLVVFSSYS